MSPDALNKLLAELKSQIASLEGVDNQKRARLDGLVEALEKSARNPADSEESGKLRDSLNESIVVLEGTHPRLTQVLNRIVELLLDIGL
ncbi:MAG: DUF4404 family protein [Candidatus Omnitrophica bacterium]|nr:DUF4404 family protein [Candidatus Omnitrophota bacterium]